MHDYDHKEISRIIETGDADEWRDLVLAARVNKDLLGRVMANLYGPPSDIKFRERYETMAELVLDIRYPPITTEAEYFAAQAER